MPCTIDIISMTTINSFTTIRSLLSCETVYIKYIKETLPREPKNEDAGTLDNPTKYFGIGLSNAFINCVKINMANWINESVMIM